jgi:DNA-binding CsgD family transcriptional regulator/signal transduction histidine kinase
VSDDITPQLSAALASVVPHRAIAILAGACARSPMLAHGDPEVAPRITTADLAQLAATVPVGDAWQGSAPIAGARRPIVAAAAAAAGTGSLLVIVRSGDAPLDASAMSVVKGIWGLLAANLDQRLEEAEPGDLAASRHAASERARVAAQLADAYGATLSALLGTLRARDLDDGAARRAATDLAAAALVDLRASSERERQLSDEPAEQAFALLRDELRPLVRYGSTEIELAGVGRNGSSDATLPSTVAQAARAIVRGAVLTMLEQDGVRRIRVGWELDGDLRISVRDDGPGVLVREGLAVHGLADRAQALDGELALDSVPGWGTHLQARLPLGPARAAPPAGMLAALNPRELEVLEHLARGRRNRQIAGDLSISENTVKFHVANVLSKLDAGSRGEAGAIARDAGVS